MKVTQSCPTLATPWIVARKVPLSMGFSRQECWRGLPFPSPGDLPDPGIEPMSPALQADSLLNLPAMQDATSTGCHFNTALWSRQRAPERTHQSPSEKRRVGVATYTKYLKSEKPLRSELMNPPTCPRRQENLRRYHSNTGSSTPNFNGRQFNAAFLCGHFALLH